MARPALTKEDNKIIDLMHKGKTHAEIGRKMKMTAKDVHDRIIYIWQVKAGKFDY